MVHRSTLRWTPSSQASGECPSTGVRPKWGPNPYWQPQLPDKPGYEPATSVTYLAVALYNLSDPFSLSPNRPQCQTTPLPMVLSSITPTLPSKQAPLVPSFYKVTSHYILSIYQSAHMLTHRLSLYRQPRAPRSRAYSRASREYHSLLLAFHLDANIEDCRSMPRVLALMVTSKSPRT